MGFDDEQAPDRKVLNTLSFSQSQVNWILGNSLAQLYGDVLKSPLPDQLQALVDQLPRPDTLDEGEE
jgi:hypothetical protein